MTKEQGRTGLPLEGENILTLFDYTVIVALRSALAMSTPLDSVDSKAFSCQGLREGGVAARQREHSRNNNHRWPPAHGQIGNSRPIRRSDSVGRGCIMLNHHHGSFCVEQSFENVFFVSLPRV